MLKLTNKLGEDYVILGGGDFQLSSNISASFKKIASSPDIVYWDDLVVTYDSFLHPKTEVISLNMDDTYLFNQMELGSKIAVKKSVLLKKVPNEQPDAQVSGLLMDANLERVKLDNVYRYLPNYKKAYQPKTTLRPSNKAKSVSIIVNYRDGLALIEHFLVSLSHQKIQLEVELILVNNQSKVGVESKVKGLCKDLLGTNIKVQYVDYDATFNHSAQNNLAATRANGEVLILMNNDAYFLSDDVVEQLSHWALEPGIATAGVSILGEKSRVVSTGIAVSKNHLIPDTYVIHETDRPFLLDLVHETAGNTFACAAVSKVVWEQIGGLDAQRFPTQYNDADFNLKCLESGLKNVSVGYLKVFHEPGASEPRDRAKRRDDRQRLSSLHPLMPAFHSKELTTRPARRKDINFRITIKIFLMIQLILEAFHFNRIRLESKILSLWKKSIKNLKSVF